MSSSNQKEQASHSLLGKPIEMGMGNVFNGPKESRESAQLDGKSSSVNPKDLGTIFMGPSESRESSLEKLLGNQAHFWNKNTEEEYMNRVKEKALVKVKALLMKAEEKAQNIIAEAEEKAKEVQKQAESNLQEAQQAKAEAQNLVAEAENIKAKAYEEGNNAGLHQAQISLDQAKTELTSAVSYVLLSMHEQCITIFNSWRKDLSELLLEAVETSTGYLLDNNKTQMLQALLEQSVNALLDKREYQIRVHPNDAMILTELLEHMHKDVAHSRRWNLVSDDALSEGSIVVESPSGLIKNSRDKRENFVSEILAGLTLPLGEGDQIAYDAITQNLVEQARNANIPLGNEENPEEAQSPDQQNLDQQNQAHAEQTPFSDENISQDEPLTNEAEQFTEPLAENVVEQAPEAVHTIDENAVNQTAQDMVENELAFDTDEIKQMQEEISQSAEESVADVQENSSPIEEKTQSNKDDKTEYTPELADELLNEMGFN